MTKQEVSSLALDLCPRLRFARCFVQSHRETHFKAKTQVEKERTLSDCLFIGKFFLWVVEPLARESKTLPEAALEYSKLSRGLFDLGRGIQDPVEFLPTDEIRIVLDQLENLTMQVFELKEEIRAAGKTLTLRRAA